MTLTGKSEEQALASLNIHNIIQEYNESNHINYEYNAKVLEYKTNLKVFNHSIFIGVLIPFMSFVFINTELYVKYNTFDFDDHSTQLLIVLLTVIAYGLHFIINMIYLFIKLIINIKKKKIKIILLNMLLLFAYYIISGYLTGILFYSFIVSNIFPIILITVLVFSPYIYFIIKKKKLEKESTSLKKQNVF